MYDQACDHLIKARSTMARSITDGWTRCRASTDLRLDKQACATVARSITGERVKSRWSLPVSLFWRSKNSISFTIRRVDRAPRCMHHHRRSRRHHHDIILLEFSKDIRRKEETHKSAGVHIIGRGQIKRGAYHRPRWRLAASGRDRETSMHQMRARLRTTSVEGVVQDTGRRTRTFA